MFTPDEADTNFDALYNEFINAAQAAARQALNEEREEREIQEARQELLDLFTHN